MRVNRRCARAGGLLTDFAGRSTESLFGLHFAPLPPAGRILCGRKVARTTGQRRSVTELGSAGRLARSGLCRALVSNGSGLQETRKGCRSRGGAQAFCRCQGSGAGPAQVIHSWTRSSGSEIRHCHAKQHQLSRVPRGWHQSAQPPKTAFRLLSGHARLVRDARLRTAATVATKFSNAGSSPTSAVVHQTFAVEARGVGGRRPSKDSAEANRSAWSTLSPYRP